MRSKTPLYLTIAVIFFTNIFLSNAYSTVSYNNKSPWPVKYANYKRTSHATVSGPHSTETTINASLAIPTYGQKTVKRYAPVIDSLGNVYVAVGKPLNIIYKYNEYGYFIGYSNIGGDIISEPVIARQYKENQDNGIDLLGVVVLSTDPSPVTILRLYDCQEMGNASPKVLGSSSIENDYHLNYRNASLLFTDNYLYVALNFSLQDYYYPSRLYVFNTNSFPPKKIKTIDLKLLQLYLSNQGCPYGGYGAGEEFDEGPMPQGCDSWEPVTESNEVDAWFRDEITSFNTAANNNQLLLTLYQADQQSSYLIISNVTNLKMNNGSVDITPISQGSGMGSYEYIFGSPTVLSDNRIINTAWYLGDEAETGGEFSEADFFFLQSRYFLPEKVQPFGAINIFSVGSYIYKSYLAENPIYFPLAADTEKGRFFFAIPTDWQEPRKNTLYLGIDDATGHPTPIPLGIDNINEGVAIDKDGYVFLTTPYQFIAFHEENLESVTTLLDLDPNSGPYSAPVVGSNGKVYFTGGYYSTSLYTVPKQLLTLDPPIYTGPLFTYNGNLTAYDIKDVTLEWKKPAGAEKMFLLVYELNIYQSKSPTSSKYDLVGEALFSGSSPENKWTIKSILPDGFEPKPGFKYYITIRALQSEGTNQNPVTEFVSSPILMALPSQEKIFEDVFYKYETTCMEYETICPKECGELNRDCIEKCGAINACFAWQTGNVSEASFFGGTEADIYKNKCSQYSASDYTKYVITPDTPKKQEDAKVGMSMHGFLNYSNSESFWKCSVKKFTAKLRNIFSPNRFNDYKTEVTTGIPPIIKMPISPEKINIRTDSILKNETLKEKNR